MQRTQLIAAIVLVLVVAGLVAGRITGDSEPAVDTAAAEPAVETGASEPAAVADATPETNAAPETGSQATSAPPTTIPVDAPERFGHALQFANLDGWLQTDARNLDDFDGQVRIVQFWTFGCHNCKATIPHLQGIYERWQPEGLEILAIHAPEFDYEKDPDAIAAAAGELGVIWPIALDTNKTNFRSWQTSRRFWPRTYVVDQEGEIRFDHIGEGRYEELEATVAYLVENGP